MSALISVKPKKRGRPPTGKDPLIAFRSPPELTEQISKWAAKQKDAPSRSEAIRRLVEKALGAGDAGAFIPIEDVTTKNHEYAGVEFTNGDGPGVRLRKGSGK